VSTVTTADREKDESLLRNNLPLFRSSFSLSTAAAIAAFGGFVFWVLVARVAPATRVGEAAALFSSIQFVNYATGLGLPIAVARYGVTGRQAPSILFNWAIVFTVASSFVGAAVYFAIVPQELHSLSEVGIAASVLIFGVIVSGISIGTVLDVRLISQGRRTWVVARSVFILLIRVPFIFIHSITTSTIGIFLVAAGAPALCGILAWLLVDLRGVKFAFPLRPLPSDTKLACRFAVVNGAAQLAVQGPFYALPVIVLLIVSPRENASFYVAWTIATVLFLVVQGIGQALLVEGNRSGHLQAQTRAALRFALALAGALAVVCTLGSRVIPMLYGSSYDPGARILPALSLAAIPWAVFTVTLSATRVRHEQRRNLGLSLFFVGSILLPAVILVVEFGIEGASWAWLLGNTASASVALVACRTLLRSGDTNPTGSGDFSVPDRLVDLRDLT
jgi:O-antigen/teichoic acid export membrane protein